MNLNISDWKPFVTSRLFHDMQNGKANQQMLDEGNECFYVGAKKDDNGVMLHCLKDENLMTKGNCIIFICNGQGSVGYSNYMDVDFIGTTDIVAGYNDNLNSEVGAFLATIYSQERPKYSFGRKWKTKLADTEVNLPVQHNTDGSIFIDNSCKYSDDGYVPDWRFMEEYIKSLHHKQLTTKNKPGQVPDLKVNEWKEFRVGDLFDITRGHTLSVEDKENFVGDIPCVNGTSENNGVQCYLSDDIQAIGFEKIKSPALSIVRVGEGGRTFVQSEDFYIADNAFALTRKTDLNVYHLFFISSLLDKECIKYSYGRTVTIDYIDTIIKLPVDANGNPDWQYMENYIKSLPYGDRLEG